MEIREQYKALIEEFRKKKNPTYSDALNLADWLNRLNSLQENKFPKTAIHEIAVNAHAFDCLYGLHEDEGLEPLPKDDMLQSEQWLREIESVLNRAECLNH